MRGSFISRERSGSGLNAKGGVIGINTAIVATGQGIGFAIPINMAKTVVEAWVDKGTISRGRLVLP